MIYGSVCSGIEAATVAWHELGWDPAFYSEIDRFPRAVLTHHYPDVPLRGDFTEIGQGDHEPIELLVGGTPCVSFSVAGKRLGLDDPRGNLALEFLALAGRLRPQWLVWENVPGLLSSDGGRDFCIFLGTLGELGYGYAYRILDAQYFGVPQRRRRIFVVGYLGDWRPPAAVLFERESMSGNPAPRREEREGVARTLGSSSGERGWNNDLDRSGAFIPLNDLDGVSHALSVPNTASGRQDPSVEDFIEVHGVVHAGESEEQSPTLRSGGHVSVQKAMAVRRLTPVECERLQGFPDDYTLVPYRNKPAEDCPDGPRYKALGNSMAVPVMRWIGERIQIFESLTEKN